MDGSQFDTLTRGLVSSTSRRNVVVAIAGGLLGLAGRKAVDARACRRDGDICRENGHCCSGVCGAKDKRGRRLCGGCSDASQCPASVDECGVAICNAGVCGFEGRDVCLDYVTGSGCNGNPGCYCFKHISGAHVCAAGGTCAVCASDDDCTGVTGPGSRCIIPSDPNCCTDPPTACQPPCPGSI